jgi:HlyD family secretion protein
MKKLKAGIVIAAVAGTATMAALSARRDDGAPVVSSAVVTRGAIVSTISATGTLEAVSAVEVGSQVSGVIESLFADFNSIVRKGQVIARLDQSLFRSAIEQQQANVLRAQAEVERARVTETDTETKLGRAQELSARELIPRNELDNARLARDMAAVQVRSAEAGLTQARAALRQAQVNLDKTVITSPIDGIVISRNVDVGQTVAASMSAPVLFVIAADLARMQVSASVDESDMGRVANGQPVSFTVDAYPGHDFTGVVDEVRLNPVVANNVVTYTTIVTAPNPELKLKPGMTASLTVEVGRRDGVLRAPAAATRFKPSADVLAALGAEPAPKGSVVWTYVEGRAEAVPMKLGASDGVWTELLGTSILENTPLITRVAIGDEPAPRANTPASSPLMGSQPQRR